MDKEIKTPEAQIYTPADIKKDYEDKGGQFSSNIPLYVSLNDYASLTKELEEVKRSRNRRDKMLKYSQQENTRLREAIKLHEKYIELLGNELMDAGSIAKIAGWKLKHEVEMAETVVKISAIKNKLEPPQTNNL